MESPGRELDQLQGEFGTRLAKLTDSMSLVAHSLTVGKAFVPKLLFFLVLSSSSCSWLHEVLAFSLVSGKAPGSPSLGFSNYRLLEISWKLVVITWASLFSEN